MVKTFGPRGTVHLLPAADLGRWMTALCAVPHRSPFPDGVRLTPEQTAVVVEAIAAVLDGRELTVDQLTEALGEVVSAWAVVGDLDVTTVESNSFEMEWPPRSGRTAEFPEVDRAGWFDPDTARKKLVRGQVPFIDLLIAALSDPSSA